jgi:hypothetical protein
MMKDFILKDVVGCWGYWKVEIDIEMEEDVNRVLIVCKFVDMIYFVLWMKDFTAYIVILRLQYLSEIICDLPTVAMTCYDKNNLTDAKDAMI